MKVHLVHVLVSLMRNVTTLADQCGYTTKGTESTSEHLRVSGGVSQYRRYSNVEGDGSMGTRLNVDGAADHHDSNRGRLT
jgi:hypothetical protein